MSPINAVIEDLFAEISNLGEDGVVDDFMLRPSGNDLNVQVEVIELIEAEGVSEDILSPRTETPQGIDLSEDEGIDDKTICSTAPKLRLEVVDSKSVFQC